CPAPDKEIVDGRCRPGDGWPVTRRTAGEAIPLLSRRLQGIAAAGASVGGTALIARHRLIEFTAGTARPARPALSIHGNRCHRHPDNPARAQPFLLALAVLSMHLILLSALCSVLVSVLLKLVPRGR